MNGLLCCAEILAVLLFIPWTLCDQSTKQPNAEASTTSIESTNSGRSPEKATIDGSATTLTTPKTTTPTTTTPTTTTPTTTTPTTAKTWTFFNVIENTYAKIVLLLACPILLISTLALACKVCQLRRRLKATGGDSEYWMGMDKTSKAESQPEPKENSLLLTENGQTTKESDIGAAKEDGGKVDEVKQQGDEKEVGDSQKGEGAATAAAPEESSPPSKPAEEPTSSEPTKDPPPPSSSENTEEPKKDP